MLNKNLVKSNLTLGLGCRKLVLLGIFNLPVFDFTKYDVYYLLDLRNCAEI